MDPNITALGFSIDKNKHMKCISAGPKYIIISRDSAIDKSDSLNEVSPFLIKKVIDNVCGGEVDMCKKLRNGTLLVKTKSFSQAQKLIELTSFSPTIHIISSEHNTLNYTKGVIYCNDLRNISEDVILKELKADNVAKVEKILKKVDNKLLETGLIVITFASHTLPESISVGYEKIRVRTYIPRPMRCTNCWMYGHTKKFCKNPKTCANCSNEYHLKEEDQDCCLNLKSCKNCKNSGFPLFNHAIYDKDCPVFLKEKEIQAIITLDKISRASAITIYEQRNPGNKQSFAHITTSSPLPSTPISNETQSTFGRGTTRTTAKTILDYSDLEILKNNSQSSRPKPASSKTVSILPKNISKRARNQLKKIGTRASTSKPSLTLSDDSSDNGHMDLDQS